MYALTYNLPNGKSFAFAPRSGTSSLAAAALQRFFPDKWENQTNGAAHRALPFSIDDKWRDCVIVVRNPVERFVSLCARTGTPPCTALGRLYWVLGAGAKLAIDRADIEHTSVDWLYHYSPLSSRIENCELFPFSRLGDAAACLGLPSLPHINYMTEKPLLTHEHEQIVREIYASDIALWESLR
jgi:hypothetical protein